MERSREIEMLPSKTAGRRREGVAAPANTETLPPDMAATPAHQDAYRLA